MSHPDLRSGLRFVILGALLVAFTLAWGALNEMHRTHPPVIETNAGFRWSALDPATDEPVARNEWIEEATR